METIFKPEPEVTEEYIRIRVKDPGLFRKDTFRTVVISKKDGIKSVQGKLKKPPEGQEGSMVVQSYLFDKDKWTVTEAQKWADEHKKDMAPMEPMKKFIDFEIKEVNEDDRSFVAVASSSRRDRDGDILLVDKWKLNDFKKNPVLLWLHDWRGQTPTGGLPIGRAEKLEIVDGKLQFKAKFVPKEILEFADKVFQMYKQKFLRTFSVGFLAYKIEPLTEEDKKGSDNPFGHRIWPELLEISAVPVPSNPDALAQRDVGILIAKCFKGIDTEPEADLESDSLPHHHNDGAVNLDMLKGSMGVLLGARGGISGIDEEEKKGLYNHLAKHYCDIKIDVPELKEYSPEDLRGMFKDVWHSDILDIQTRAQDSPAFKSGRVLSAKNRKIVQAAHNALAELLKATEETPDKDEEKDKDKSFDNNPTVIKIRETIDATNKIITGK